MKRVEKMDSACQPWHLRQVQAAPAQSATHDVPTPQQAFETARARGYQEGWAAGQADAAAQLSRELAVAGESAAAAVEQERAALERARNQLQAVLAGIQHCIDAQAEHACGIAVEVSYAAVTKVIGERYATPELMQDLCLQALKDAPHKVAAVRVSPQDAVLTLTGAAVEIVPDPRLVAGQCVLEMATGHYEVGLDVRLEALKGACLAGLVAHSQRSSVS